MSFNNSYQLLTEAVEQVSQTYAVAPETHEFAESLVGNDSVYSDFMLKLAEGLHPIEQRDFLQYAKNSKEEAQNSLFLSENTASVMSKFAVLDSLMLREIWMRLGARDAMTYKVLQSPTIQVPFLKQYMRDTAGNLVDVPTALRDSVFNFKTADIEIDLKTKNEVNLFEEASIDNPNGNLTVNKFGEFYSFTCQTQADGGGSEVADVEQVIKAGQEGNFRAVVNFKHNSTNYTDTLVGYVDRVTGKIEVTSLKGLIKKAKYRAKVSVETNNFTQNMTQTTEKIVIAVGDGDTINSDIPIQYLQDMKALFKLDAVSEISKLLSQTFATIYDMEVYKTFQESIELADQTINYDASIIHNNAHLGISRQMQNASLLDRVYRGIAMIDNRYNFSGSVEYYVMANPIDNSILSGGVAPDYAGTPNQGGAIKHYTSGQVVGNYAGGDVRVVSSRIFKSGELILVPKPSVDSEICFGYYDYSSVLLPLGTYRNPQNELVPNIMMNKRKVIHTFRPNSTQKIVVKNNTAE